MAKEEPLEFRGKVLKILPGGKFQIELDESGHIVEGTLSGKMRTNNIKVILYDEVTVEMTPYDLTKGRVTFRHK